MTALAYFNMFPEFTALSDETKNALISQASACLDTSLFCADSGYVIALYAAHMATLTSVRALNGSGAVTSIREGDLSISFGTFKSTSSLGQTSYGNVLLQLMKSAGAGVAMDVI